QVGGAGQKRNVTPIGADPGVGAESVGYRAADRYRYACGRGRTTCDPNARVAHKDVFQGVRAARHQVGGRGSKGDEPSVSAHRSNSIKTPAVSLRAVVGYRHAHSGGPAAGRTNAGVPNEDLGEAISITSDRVTGIGSKSDETSVGADGRSERRAVGLAAVVGYRYTHS